MKDTVLRELELRSFQCHRKLKVALAPTVTTIIGATDSGKSAVIRALRWLCSNRPLGATFIERGRKRCRVALVLSDGTRIERARSRSVNTYVLDDKQFVSFGNDVPAPIAQRLSVDELNFQLQHDSPLWFVETGRQVAEHLNAIVDLGIIDKTLARASSLVREAKSRCGMLASQLREAKVEVSRFAHAPRFDRDLSGIEAMDGKARALRASCARLNSLMIETASFEQILARAKVASTLGDKLSTVIESCNKIDEQCKTLCELISIVDRFEREAGAFDFGACLRELEKGRALSVSIGLIQDLIQACVEKDKALSDRESELRIAEFDFARQTKGRPCPICGKRLP